jgi:uncharacterized membrane protein (DUF485 family)
MTDVDLLAFGCAVMGFVFGGVYVYFRAQFTRSEARSSADLGAHPRPEVERIAS